MASTPILDAIERNRPIIGGLIKAVAVPIIEGMRRESTAPIAEIVDEIAPAIAARIESNPVLKNQLNLEAPVQSRVVLGSTLAMVSALIVAFGQLVSLFNDFSLTSFDYATAGASVGAIVGISYALYGRLATGLKPLFSRGGSS